MKVGDIVNTLVDGVSAPAPFDFMLKIILGFGLVFLVFLLLYLPIFILIRMLRGRR